VGSATPIGIVRINEVIKIVQPLLVHAGDRVRLWSQNDTVRIEMSGVVEQSARSGDRVMVQVTRQSDDAGLTVERIAGIVCGSGDVEIER
jgi:flagella basal body P-ring formation protein FlgA